MLAQLAIGLRGGEQVVRERDHRERLRIAARRRDGVADAVLRRARVRLRDPVRPNVALRAGVDRLDLYVDRPEVDARRKDLDVALRQRLLAQGLEPDVVRGLHDGALRDADVVGGLVREALDARRPRFLHTTARRGAGQLRGDVGRPEGERVDVRAVRSGAEVVLQRAERLRYRRDHDRRGGADDREEHQERADQRPRDAETASGRGRRRLC